MSNKIGKVESIATGSIFRMLSNRISKESNNEYTLFFSRIYPWHSSFVFNSLIFCNSESVIGRIFLVLFDTLERNST